MGKVYLVQHADGCECVTAIMVFTDKEIAKRSFRKYMEKLFIKERDSWLAYYKKYGEEGHYEFAKNGKVVFSDNVPFEFQNLAPYTKKQMNEEKTCYSKIKEFKQKHKVIDWAIMFGVEKGWYELQEWEV